MTHIEAVSNVISKIVPERLKPPFEAESFEMFAVLVGGNPDNRVVAYPGLRKLKEIDPKTGREIESDECYVSYSGKDEYGRAVTYEEAILGTPKNPIGKKFANECDQSKELRYISAAVSAAQDRLSVMKHLFNNTVVICYKGRDLTEDDHVCYAAFNRRSNQPENLQEVPA